MLLTTPELLFKNGHHLHSEPISSVLAMMHWQPHMQVEIGIAEDAATQSAEQQDPRSPTPPSPYASEPEQHASSTTSAAPAPLANGTAAAGSKPGTTKSARARQAKKRRAAQAAAHAAPASSKLTNGLDQDSSAPLPGAEPPPASTNSTNGPYMDGSAPLPGAEPAPASTNSTNGPYMDGSAPLPGAGPVVRIPEGRPQPQSRPSSSKSSSSSNGPPARRGFSPASSKISSTSSMAMPQKAPFHESDALGGLNLHGEFVSQAHPSASAAASGQDQSGETGATAASWDLPMMSPLSGRTQAYLKGAKVLEPSPEPISRALNMHLGESPKAPSINSEPEEPEAGSQPLAPGSPSKATQKQKPKQPVSARPYENGHASGQLPAQMPAANGLNSNQAATGLDRAASGGLKRGFFGNRKPSPMPGQHASKHAASSHSGSMPAKPAGLHPAEQDSMAEAAHNSSAGLNGRYSDDQSSTDESMPDHEEAAADHAPASPTNGAAAAAAATTKPPPSTHTAAAASSVGSTPQASSSTPSADAHHRSGGTCAQNSHGSSFRALCLTLLGYTSVSITIARTKSRWR